MLGVKARSQNRIANPTLTRQDCDYDKEIALSKTGYLFVKYTTEARINMISTNSKGDLVGAKNWSDTKDTRCGQAVEHFIYAGENSANKFYKYVRTFSEGIGDPDFPPCGLAGETDNLMDNYKADFPFCDR